jgi:hypothetical protein
MQPWRGLALWLAFVGASCAKPTQQVSSAPLAGENPIPPANPIPPKNPIPAENPITVENALPGDRGWAAGTGVGRAVEMYLDRVSARAGDAVQAKVSSDGPHDATWALYRIGWYGGAGARKVASGRSGRLSNQPACPVEPLRGFLRCAWAAAFSLTVPAGAVSGLYVVKVTRDDGPATLAPLVVRDERGASLLFQSSVTTAQAYNPWGGESLYQDAGRTVPGQMATAVSFDRPYRYFGGAGPVLLWEAPFARFLERSGYDVTYTTNLDVARAGAPAPTSRGAFLSVGHDEYWAPQERDAVEAAREAGTHLLFFGANAAYWKVRLEDPGADGNARTVVCYKMRPESDPDQGPGRTGRFRDVPENRPENELIGVMYESWLLVAHSWTVADAAHFLYAGTGLSTGDVIPQIVGYEYDRRMDAQPPGVLGLAGRAAVVDAEGKPGVFEATSYRAPSGALVFGAGTIYWANALDGPGRDPRVERMTANVFREALKLPIPSALQDTALPQVPAARAAPAPTPALVAGGFPGPSALAVLPDSALVVADARANQIFRIEPAPSFAVSLLAGDGNPSASKLYDGVPGLRARFFGPSGIAADGAGNLYVADTHNDCIRRIASDAAHTVTTFAGMLGAQGSADGIGAAARFFRPMGIAWDGPRNRLVVADSGNHKIRAINVATAAVTTLAGSAVGVGDGPGASARCSFPTAVAIAEDGRVFVISSGDSMLKVVGADAQSTVTTLVMGGAGYADGPGTTAKLAAQGGLAWAAGSLYVSDPGNSRIRLVRPGADAAGTTVSSWAGTGLADNGPAALGLPLGLALGRGVLYAVDASTGSVRSIPR